MATSPLFGWEEPDDVDLVKDGAAAIRTLGNAIDTSMGDLLGGTTGQVLSKASNTNMDFTWVTSDDANAIQNSIVNAKGDLIGASANDTPAILSVGNNGETLVADSSTSTGLKWKQQGLTFIKRTTFSFVSSQDIDSVFDTSKYTDYLVTIEGFGGSVSSADGYITFLYSGVEQSAAYYGYFSGGNYLGTAASFTMNNGPQGQISRDLGNVANFSVTDTAGYCVFRGNTMNYNNAEYFDGSFYCGTPRTYTGFRVKASSGTVSGTVTVYGLAKA